MALSPCKQCGGTVRRSRRKLVERFFYAEASRCERCGVRSRRATWDLKHARYVKCPRCHSVDLTLLKRRDGIDRMQGGVINFINKLLGGKLYHCWFCRLQFYDLRPRYNKDNADDQNAAPPPDDRRSDLEVAS